MPQGDIVKPEKKETHKQRVCDASARMEAVLQQCRRLLREIEMSQNAIDKLKQDEV